MSMPNQAQMARYQTSIYKGALGFVLPISLFLSLQGAGDGRGEVVARREENEAQAEA